MAELNGKLNLNRAYELDERLTWMRGGRWHRFHALSYRQLAARNPGLAQWIAQNISGARGRLAAEALAISLGVPE